MEKKYLIIVMLGFMIACSNSNRKHSPFELFSEQKNASEVSCYFDDELFGRIETLQCNDSLLIVFDYHSGFSFTLFDLKSDKMLGRFGAIGQGPGEILLGCYGYLYEGNFTINYDLSGFLAWYPIDSLRKNIHFNPLVLNKYEIADAQFSRVIPLNDTTFLGAGTYQSKFQFVLFDNKSNVMDAGVEIYNADDKKFNPFHKYLSNQGILNKHPLQSKFVYAVNYSSNMDFIEVSNNTIKLIKSLRLRNPVSEALQDGNLSRVMPDRSNPIGYIDIASTNDYVYALYTDKLLTDKEGNSNSKSSDLVLVYDWEGNPVKIVKLNQEVYYITVNEKQAKLYAAVINESKGWSITSYRLDKFD